MECKYFEECGSCTLCCGYDEQKKLKIGEIETFFGDKIDYKWHSSKDIHYRSRAEFSIWHKGDKISYAMYRRDKNGKLLIDNCPKVDDSISALMPSLLKAIQEKSILRQNLFGVEFLSSNQDIVATLLYHKKLDGFWEVEAQKCAKFFNIKIVGRSKGVKIVIGGDFVSETLNINGKFYKYKIQEGTFSQPNRSINEQMISWVINSIDVSKRVDLLELYCGYGNFTIPMSFLFRKVLATEISKASIAAARENTILNSVNNIEFTRLSSEELIKALDYKMDFKRLQSIELSSYDFSHVFVDPPRAGLDNEIKEFLKNFKTIIYISCNPNTLKIDLDKFYKTHSVKSFALFDQFPYTKHIESGVILDKIAQ